MKPFELRLASQHSRNARHIKNLKIFIADCVRFGRLEQEDRELLMEQLKCMTALDAVYRKRMARLNIPV